MLFYLCELVDIYIKNVQTDFFILPNYLTLYLFDILMYKINFKC